MSDDFDEKKYEEKMIRVSRLEYLNETSDFVNVSVEEFEIWKNTRPLGEKERLEERLRRRELEAICEIYLNGYFEKSTPLDGKLSLLEILKSVCTPNDHAIMGRFVLNALNNRTTKGPGRSGYPRGFKSLVRHYVKFLGGLPKEETFLFGFPGEVTLEDGSIAKFPGETLDDRFALIHERFRLRGLQGLDVSPAALREIARVRATKDEA